MSNVISNDNTNARLIVRQDVDRYFNTKEKTKEIAKSLHLHAKDLYFLFEKNIISLRDENLQEKLKLIAKLWHSNFFVRRMLSYRSGTIRKKLIDTAELTKPEQHAYARLSQLEKFDREKWKKIFGEICNYYNVPPEIAEKIMRRMAFKIRMQRYYQRKKNKKNIEDKSY